MTGPKIRPGQPFPHVDDRWAGVRHVIASRRVVHGGRVLYGTGDRVPWADAVRFGLVEAVASEPRVAAVRLLWLAADDPIPRCPCCGAEVDEECDPDCDELAPVDCAGGGFIPCLNPPAPGSDLCAVCAAEGAS